MGPSSKAESPSLRGRETQVDDLAESFQGLSWDDRLGSAPGQLEAAAEEIFRPLRPQEHVNLHEDAGCSIPAFPPGSQGLPGYYPYVEDHSDPSSYAGISMQSAPGFSTLYGQQQGMTKQPPQQDGGYVMKASSPSQSTALKMLVRDRMAGRLIGRGGSVLQDIQSRSGATLRVSSCGTYFPGTNERVVLVTGDHNQVKEACRLILTALHRGREKVAPSSTEAWNVPARESESMSELSGAQFNLSQRELSVLVGERIVMIKSTLQNVITALDLLQDKLLEGAPPQRYDNMSTNYGNRAVTLGIPSLDGYHPASSRHRGPLDLPPTYRHSGSSTHHHSPIPGGVLGPVSPHAGDSSAGHHHHVDVIGHPGHGPPQEGDPTLVMPQQHHRHETNHAHHSRHPAGVNCEQPLSTIMVAISDRSAGVILGRAGATLSELQARSKARITVSQRGVHHVSNRIVTIQGYLEATQTALHLINLMVETSAVRWQDLEGAKMMPGFLPMSGEACGRPPLEENH